MRDESRKELCFYVELDNTRSHPPSSWEARLTERGLHFTSEHNNAKKALKGNVTPDTRKTNSLPHLREFRFKTEKEKA